MRLMRLRWLCAAMILPPSLSGCAGAAGFAKTALEVGASGYAAWRSAKTEQTVTRLVDLNCTWSKPIRPTEAEFLSLSEETQRQIIIHNEKQKHFCGGGE